ncbi:hypothetical protein [Actinoallomurus acanthiterrae]
MVEFGLREFQLYILGHMPYSEHVAEALDGLDASWDAAKQAIKAVERMEIGKLVHTIDVEISVLGEPRRVFPVPAEDVEFADRKESQVFAFELPVFEDFMYLVNVVPQGYCWGSRLGRRPDAKAPRIEALEDLRPWGAIKKEVLRELTKPEMIEGFSHYEVYKGTILERATGEPVEVLVEFDMELLQWVKRANDPE